MLKKHSWFIIILLIALVYLGKYLYFKPKYTNGNAAASFNAQLLSGESFNLADLKGQYVLLDFWGSWCGPCRKANPHLRTLHQKYNTATFDNGKGLVIVNIGIEKDSSRWQKAIIQDQLSWPYHIMDQTSSLRFFNGKISSMYNIREVPTTYLIDPNGNIIGMNMEAKMMERLLDQHLSK